MPKALVLVLILISGIAFASNKPYQRGVQQLKQQQAVLEQDGLRLQHALNEDWLPESLNALTKQQLLKLQSELEGKSRYYQQAYQQLEDFKRQVDLDRVESRQHKDFLQSQYVKGKVISDARKQSLQRAVDRVVQYDQLVLRIDANLKTLGKINQKIVDTLDKVEQSKQKASLIAANQTISKKQAILQQQLDALLEQVQTHAPNEQASGTPKALEAIEALATQQAIQFKYDEINYWQKQKEYNFLQYGIDNDLKVVVDNKLIVTFNTLNKRFTSIISATNNGLKRAQSQLEVLNNYIITNGNNQQTKALKKAINQTMDSMKVFLKQTTSFMQNFQNQINVYQTQLDEKMASRLGLSISMNEWPGLFKEAAILPLNYGKYLLNLAGQVQMNLSFMSNWAQACIYFAELLLFAIGFIGQRFIKTALKQFKGRSKRLSTNAIYIILQMLKRHGVGLLLSIMVITLVAGSGVGFKSYAGLVYGILITFLFYFITSVARMSLLERLTDVSGKDVVLFHRLKSLMIVGAFISLMMMMSQQLSSSYELRMLIGYGFMCFMLAVSVVLFIGRDVVPSVFKPFIPKKRQYLRKAVRILCVLLPALLFLNAFIGLSGFMQISLEISYYQAVFLLVVIGYVIARGLSVDLLELIANGLIKTFKNGWLYSEAFLKPIDKIIRLILLCGALLSIFMAFGLKSDSLIVSYALTVLNFQIFSFSGGHITILSSLEFVALVMVFIWASKWTREFCYRWAFRHINDSGIRNSLSVLSQYAVIALGTLITLRVWGIDLSGMAMILGGLAVGLGFGLRDFANNIVSGLMLLIERPVREGDVVSIGNFEGRVTHIGIRSMTVRSWDHMEVMVPNAETFNKSFTNWTHQDSIVRTVIPIKVHREDDPAMVQRLIFDVLEVMPEVLDDPMPQVFLKRIDESLIEFEVRYFINVAQHSRVETRSMVLFSIWAQFKAVGIRAPYPHQELTIKKHASSKQAPSGLELSKVDGQDQHRPTGYQQVNANKQTNHPKPRTRPLLSD